MSSDDAVRISSKDEAEIEELLTSAVPENTRKATEVWCSALHSDLVMYARKWRSRTDRLVGPG